MIRTYQIPYDLNEKDTVKFFRKGKGLETANFVRRNRSSIKVKLANGTTENIHRVDIYSIKRSTGEEYHIEIIKRQYANETVELCPICEHETYLKKQGGIQMCKYCGSFIKPCSMCDMNTVNCSECKYDHKEEILRTDRAMYILINSDIKIGKGKLAGQVGHAVASYLYKEFINGNKRNISILKDYMDNMQKKILLKCPQSKLEELESEGFITIRDKGLTELEPNTLTCVNMGIYDRNNNELPEWIKEFKLYPKN